MKLNSRTTIFKAILTVPIVAPTSFVQPFGSRVGLIRTQTSYSNFARWKTTTASSISRIATHLSESNIPTIDQLATDPFMKQLNHAYSIVSLLEQSSNEDAINDNYNDDMVQKLLKAQLSHSDGIRGFFASYLTGDEETVADRDEVPTPLISALNFISESDGSHDSSNDELISLACMNVIMPTAMTTMHQDENLAKSSQTTAKRGAKIVKVLLEKPGMKKQCEAIRDAASSSSIEELNDNIHVKYWLNFFDKWGYKEQQLKDIQIVMTDILEE